MDLSDRNTTKHQRFGHYQRLRFRRLEHGNSTLEANALTIGTNSTKKVVLLGVVGLVAGSLLYIDPSRQPIPGRTNSQAPPAARSEKRIDRAIPDPKLRIDLLATLRTVDVASGVRDLFQIATAEVKKAVKQTNPESKIAPDPAPQPSNAPDVRPPAPNSLRFYGYTNMVREWPKRAFFLDGDAIYIAAEGELIKSRYKVIYVGMNSAVLEDTSNKNQQTLPLVESM